MSENEKKKGGEAVEKGHRRLTYTENKDVNALIISNTLPTPKPDKGSGDSESGGDSGGGR